MKKIVWLLLAFSLILTGCAGSSGQSEVTKPSSFLEEGNQGVWFLCYGKEPKKNSRVCCAIKVEDGVCSFYPLEKITIGCDDKHNVELYSDINKLTLGEVSDCSEEEAFEKAKNHYEKWLTSASDSVDGHIDEWAEVTKADNPTVDEKLIDERAAEIKKGIHAKLDEISTRPYNGTSELMLFTDDSRNNTSYESLSAFTSEITIHTSTIPKFSYYIEGQNGLASKDADEDKLYTGKVEDYSKLNWAYINDTLSMQIYDTYWGGFTISGLSNFRDQPHFLVKALDGNASFTMDTPDYEHENFEVDPDTKNE